MCWIWDNEYTGLSVYHEYLFAANLTAKAVLTVRRCATSLTCEEVPQPARRDAILTHEPLALLRKLLNPFWK